MLHVHSHMSFILLCLLLGLLLRQLSSDVNLSRYDVIVVDEVMMYFTHYFNTDTESK